MKSKETKERDLAAITEQLQNSKSAMVVSFSKVTVNKDQEFRNRLREAGAKYQVVKNTLARIAVKGTQYEDADEYFKGVTAIAWTDNDPVILSKAISKFIKDNSDIFSFKTGVVDGRVVDFNQVASIASLPSKEELISKLLYVLNAQAQRIVTVINAVPRDLAVVIKQIGDKAPPTSEPAAEVVAEPTAEQAASAEQTSPESTDGDEEAPVEAAVESQEKKEDEQDASSPEGQQADEAASQNSQRKKARKRRSKKLFEISDLKFEIAGLNPH